MTDTQTHGGFAGNPAAALDVAGTSGCCGNPPQATLTLPDPSRSPADTAADAAGAAAGSPCCGTTAEAT